MFMHGENDNDVPDRGGRAVLHRAQDVGVETVMVRYPREGHGLRETKHVVDALDRSHRLVQEARPVNTKTEGHEDGTKAFLRCHAAPRGLVRPS